MSKADALAQKFGGNIGQSLGVRTRPEPLPMPNDTIPMSTAETGRKRLRTAGVMEVMQIIADPDQPRKDFDQERLEELAGSIKKFGILQPITIRWDASLSKHIIVAGERRFRAAQLAGLTEVPAIFSEDGSLPESEILIRQLTENIQREQLSPMECAHAFKKMQVEDGFTAAQIAEQLFISKGLVSQRLKLLDLPEDIQAKVEDGTLSGHSGYKLSQLADATEQREVANRIEMENLGRKEIDSVVNERQSAKPKATGKAKPAAKAGRPTTMKSFKVEGVAVTLKFAKKVVTNEDVIKTLNALVATLSVSKKTADTKAA